MMQSQNLMNRQLNQLPLLYEEWQWASIGSSARYTTQKNSSYILQKREGEEEWFECIILANVDRESICVCNVFFPPPSVFSSSSRWDECIFHWLIMTGQRAAASLHSCLCCHTQMTDWEKNIVFRTGAQDLISNLMSLCICGRIQFKPKCRLFYPLWI